MVVTITVQPLGLDEVEAARGVLAASWWRIYSAEGEFAGYVEDEVLDVSARMESALVLGGYLDGALAGCVTLVLDPSSPLAEGLAAREAGMRMLGVTAAAQGVGVGAALVRACCERAWAGGARWLVLHTDAARMTGARRLYVRQGFTRCPSRDQSYPGLELWCDTKELEGSENRSGIDDP